MVCAAIEASQFFLCCGAQRKDQPMSQQRISSWLNEVLQVCYTRSNLPPLSEVKGHQVRSQAISWADMAGVDP